MTFAQEAPDGTGPDKPRSARDNDCFDISLCQKTLIIEQFQVMKRSEANFLSFHQGEFLCSGFIHPGIRHSDDPPGIDGFQWNGVKSWSFQ